MTHYVIITEHAKLFTVYDRLESKIIRQFRTKRAAVRLVASLNVTTDDSPNREEVGLVDFVLGSIKE